MKIQRTELKILLSHLDTWNCNTIKIYINLGKKTFYKCTNKNFTKNKKCTQVRKAAAGQKWTREKKNHKSCPTNTISFIVQ